jgi:hypothetical protein
MSAENAGNVISKSSAAAKQAFFRLKIDCSGDQDANAYPLNRELAEKLISIRPGMRSIQMEKCLVDVLKKLPTNAVVKNRYFQGSAGFGCFHDNVAIRRVGVIYGQ